jgi:hypothetical protein
MSIALRSRTQTYTESMGFMVGASPACEGEIRPSSFDILARIDRIIKFGNDR